MLARYSAIAHPRLPANPHARGRIAASRVGQRIDASKGRESGRDMIAMSWRTKGRAAKGLFLAFQYPVEVPGVATMTS